MKKLFVVSSCILGSLAAIASPVDPMENYTPTQVDGMYVNHIWNQMRMDLKGDDCYRRAHLWAYGMNRKHGIKSTKIFMHYTEKFNLELDYLGDEDRFEGGIVNGLFGWIGKKTSDIDHLDRKIQSLVRNNIKWNYHVAPMIYADGEPVVMDRYLDLPYDAVYPYTSDEAWDLKARPASPEEWVEALTVRGELLWQAHKQKLINKMDELQEDIDKYQRKANKKKKAKDKRKYYEKMAEKQAEIDEIMVKFRSLEMDKGDSIDIKCKKVTTIAEVDAAQETEWCLYSEAPMYYYNEIDLRNLAYGYTGYNYAIAVPTEVQTQENFENGRNYVQRYFNEEELDDAVKEIKKDRD
ncbi:MAG: hypothetical protein CME62_03320 [Halobacteriovoraceae bacterium]|nr:hypothetical protein [Halobacteriovoraceae bacterium]|tara:strand:- start:14564 stop:15619 length:1056 start_codon:yes stop_codon:yes gene_type:complete